jgi:hypothetical protein
MASKSVFLGYRRNVVKRSSRSPMFFYFATETRANCFVRLVLNDVTQTETAIHCKQNGRFIRKITNQIMDRRRGSATNPIVKK